MANHLINKSEINVDSAKFLHEKNLFSPVAHCCYYACYQRFKHIWLHKMNKSEEDLSALCKEDKINGSHEVLLNQIAIHIEKTSNTNNKTDSRVIRNNITQLKRLRVEADYLDKNFDFQKSSNSIQLSNVIIPILTKYQ